MSENPLLPHRKLKELHTLMLRCRELEQKQHRAQKSSAKRAQTAREALLAATSIHLLPGDHIFAAPGDLTAPQLAPAPKATAKSKTKFTAPEAVPPAPELSRFALAAATAHGLKSAGTDALVLSYAHAGSLEPGWQAALEWAHRNQFPLLIAVADATGSQKPATNPSIITWNATSRLAQRTKLPILTVDGEDAVAVYRAMQEAVIRARFAGGPAILWGMMTPSTTAALPRTQQPIARLNQYLKVRKIVLPK